MIWSTYIFIGSWYLFLAANASIDLPAFLAFPVEFCLSSGIQQLIRYKYILRDLEHMSDILLVWWIDLSFLLLLEHCLLTPGYWRGITEILISQWSESDGENESRSFSLVLDNVFIGSYFRNPLAVKRSSKKA